MGSGSKSHWGPGVASVRAENQVVRGFGLGWMYQGHFVSDPWHQSPHLQNGPTTPWNTWHMVISWYTYEKLVFTPTNKQKVLRGNLDNANDSCPLNEGVDWTCLY